jgi:radical SAM superfamily enzyme YgiQ (UPF0313 family)
LSSGCTSTALRLQGCFVFGLDDDDPDVFLRTAEFAVEAKVDLPRFAVVTPFPNTPLYLRLEAEGRILTRDWELYDAQHVVFQPKQMSVQQLQEGIETAWKHTYSVRSILRRIRHSPAPLPVRIGTNLGYRFYAHNLSRYYNCDWIIGRARNQNPQPAASRNPNHAPDDHSSLHRPPWATAPTCAHGRWNRCLRRRWRGLTPKDIDIRFYDDRMEVIPFDEKTDLVAISVETYTARRAYQIASSYRARGVPVVMGGFHASLCPEEVAEHAEAVVVGEAEESWPLLLDDFRHGTLQKILPFVGRPAIAGMDAAGSVDFPRQAVFEGRFGGGRARVPLQVRFLRGADGVQLHPDAASGGCDSGRAEGDQGFAEADLLRG